MPEAELKALAGLYWNARDAAARRFIFADGRLKAQPNPEARVDLKSLGGGRFVLAGPSPTYFVFANNRVTMGPQPGAGDTFERAEPFAPTAAQLESFAGVYRSDEFDAIYRMVLKDGKLWLERMKSPSAALDPLVADTFASPAGVVRFTRDGSGSVNGFLLEAGRVRGVKFWKEIAPARRSSQP